MRCCVAAFISCCFLYEPVGGAKEEHDMKVEEDVRTHRVCMSRQQLACWTSRHGTYKGHSHCGGLLLPRQDLLSASSRCSVSNTVLLICWPVARLVCPNGKRSHPQGTTSRYIFAPVLWRINAREMGVWGCWVGLGFWVGLGVGRALRMQFPMGQLEAKKNKLRGKLRAERNSAAAGAM